MVWGLRGVAHGFDQNGKEAKTMNTYDLRDLPVSTIEVLPADAMEALTAGHGMTELAASSLLLCSCGGCGGCGGCGCGSGDENE